MLQCSDKNFSTLSFPPKGFFEQWKVICVGVSLFLCRSVGYCSRQTMHWPQETCQLLYLGNLPTSIFSLTASTMSHMGACASAGPKIQVCLCGFLSQQKGQWGIAPQQKIWNFSTLSFLPPPPPHKKMKKDKKRPAQNIYSYRTQTDITSWTVVTPLGASQLMF